MTDSNLPDDHDQHFSDDDAKSIIRRAAELDKEGHVTAARLREIAGEAQISPDAMNRALAEAAAEKQMAEHQSQNISQSSRPQTYLGWQGWLLVAALVVTALLAVLRL